MRNLGLAVLVACLAGCQTGPTRQEVLASLVGKPESEALRVLGAPNHVMDVEGHRFLAYDDAGVGYVPYGGFGGFGFGYGYGYFPAAVPVVRSCVMTLDITSGRVASWTLRGNACD